MVYSSGAEGRIIWATGLPFFTIMISGLLRHAVRNKKMNPERKAKDFVIACMNFKSILLLFIPLVEQP